MKSCLKSVSFDWFGMPCGFPVELFPGIVALCIPCWLRWYVVVVPETLCCPVYVLVLAVPAPVGWDWLWRCVGRLVNVVASDVGWLVCSGVHRVGILVWVWFVHY